MPRLVVKATFGDDTRRTHVPPGSDWSWVRANLKRAFGLDGPVRVQFVDEEGDLCTLCDATLPDALSRVSCSVSLRLFISSGIWHIQNACRYFLSPSPKYASPCPSLNQARTWTRLR